MKLEDKNDKKLICKLYFNYYDEYEEIIYVYEDGIFQEGDLLDADAFFEIENRYESIEKFIEAQLEAGFEMI